MGDACALPCPLRGVATPVIAALARETRTIPIVFAILADDVGPTAAHHRLGLRTPVVAAKPHCRSLRAGQSDPGKAAKSPSRITAAGAFAFCRGLPSP
jgi:hypothetical protein